VDGCAASPAVPSGDLAPSAEGAAAAAAAAAAPLLVDELYVVSRLLLLLLTRDGPSRDLAASPDVSLADRLAELLEQWLASYQEVVGTLEGAEASGRAEEARSLLKVI